MNRFRVRFLPGSIAFAHTLRFPAGQVGIRRTIATSHDGRLLLACADPEKTTFDGLEDTLQVEDAEWQIWNSRGSSLSFRIPATAYDQATLSPSGEFLSIVETGNLRSFALGTN